MYNFGITAVSAKISIITRESHMVNARRPLMSDDKPGFFCRHHLQSVPMDKPLRDDDHDYSHDRQFRRQVERDAELRHDLASMADKHRTSYHSPSVQHLKKWKAFTKETTKSRQQILDGSHQLLRNLLKPLGVEVFIYIIFYYYYLSEIQ